MRPLLLNSKYNFSPTYSYRILSQRVTDWTRDAAAVNWRKAGGLHTQATGVVFLGSTPSIV